MRVLHVIPAVAPRYGGPSQAVIGMCRALDARGVTTLVATTNADGPDILSVPIGVPAAFETVPTIFFPRRGEGFKFSSALARWLREHVREYDVVHIHAVFSHASLSAGRACREHGVPYILRPLGSLDPWALSRKAWRKRLLLRTSVKALIAGAAALHFMTDDEQRLARPVTGRVAGAVIPPGVDEAYLARPIVPPGDRERRIVAMTRLHPVKRIAALIDAFHVASRTVEDWELVVAGDGDAAHRSELEQAATKGPAAGQIRFAGWLSGDAKRDCLCRAAVFALPSFQENFGMGLLEALACGVPAVVSRGVNLATSVERAGAGWLSGSNVVELAAALTEAMGDAADRARRSRAARAMAEEFTWTRTGEQLERLYESVRPLPVGGRW